MNQPETINQPETMNQPQLGAIVIQSLVPPDNQEEQQARQIVEELRRAQRPPFTREEHNRARMRFRIEHADDQF